MTFFSLFAVGKDLFVYCKETQKFYWVNRYGIDKNLHSFGGLFSPVLWFVASFSAPMLYRRCPDLMPDPLRILAVSILISVPACMYFRGLLHRRSQIITKVYHDPTKWPSSICVASCNMVTAVTGRTIHNTCILIFGPIFLAALSFLPLEDLSAKYIFCRCTMLSTAMWVIYATRPLRILYLLSIASSHAPKASEQAKPRLHQLRYIDFGSHDSPTVVYIDGRKIQDCRSLIAELTCAFHLSSGQWPLDALLDRIAVMSLSSQTGYALCILNYSVFLPNDPLLKIEFTQLMKEEVLCRRNRWTCSANKKFSLYLAN